MILDSTSEPLPEMLQALGRIPSGLFILTVGQPGQPGAVATIVSFVQQISLEPLYVAIAIRKGRPIHGVLHAATPRPKFILNITHAGDRSLLRKYAKESLVGPTAFDNVPHRLSDTGHTILTEACAYLELELIQVIDTGSDHDLFIALPIGGEILGDPANKPMVHIRHDGGKY